MNPSVLLTVISIYIGTVYSIHIGWGALYMRYLYYLTFYPFNSEDLR